MCEILNEDCLELGDWPSMLDLDEGPLEEGDGAAFSLLGVDIVAVCGRASLTHGFHRCCREREWKKVTEA